MNRAFRLFSVVLFFFAVKHASAQDYPVLHYTVEEGLPSNVVYSVYRDSKGYIWIGTDKGVARFNGLKFEIFSTFNGLPDNEIFFIKEDHYGRRWLGTFNGALCYYKDGVFHTAENTPFLRLSFVQPHMRYISNQYDSTIIISYSVPTQFLAIHNESIKIFDLAELNRPDIFSVFSFAEKVSDNKYRLICKDKIVYIDTAYRVLEMKMLPTEFYRPSGAFASCQDQDYLHNDSCFFPFDMSFAIAAKTLKNINAIHEIYMEGGDVYFATANGLIVNDSLNLLRNHNVSAITQDDQKNYWISTLDNGVYVLKKKYRHSQFYKDVYKGTARYACVRNHRLFFATADNNLYKIENDNISCLFNYAKTKHGYYDYPTEFGFLIDDKLSYYNFYNTDFTVIDNLLSPKATTNEVQPVAGAKEVYQYADYFFLRMPRYIRRVRKSKIYTGTDYYTIQSNVGDRIFYATQAPDSSIWYSTITSMYKVANTNSDGILQEQFRNISLKYFCIFGGFMAGYTHDNMLLIFSDYTGTAVAIDTIAPRNCIWDKMYQIDSNHVLISSNNYYRILTKNPPDSVHKFSLYPIENAFLPIRAEVICSDSNNWYFFKKGSVTVVGRDDLLTRASPPKLYFTGIKTVNGQVPVSEDVSLAFGASRNITLSFSMLTFSGGDVQCQYSVSKNGEVNWRDVKGEEINLVGIASGDYVINLRAKTLSSDYCIPVKFKLHILSPFWLTWWFITLVCVGLASIAGIIIRYRVVRLLRKKEKEHDTELRFMRSEYKALNALMNPHFIFNTLNNVQGLVNRDDKLAANEYIRVFADLIRQNMHNISKELIPLQNEINLVNNYLALEKLRFKEHLNYIIDIAEGLDLSEIMVPPLLVQPLVENSIKHGIYPLESGDGQIRVHIFEHNNVLVIEVMDNGVGIHIAKEGKRPSHESFGLENIRKRIDQLSAILDKRILFDIGEKKSNDGINWTVVTISIPITPTS
ncbi:MAG: diguanylate cyclase [Flavipsychrobacter sp.]|jgi:hypothetical protein|nr:diguanylate cyclase [Flavipsychrobacter sp.]